MIWGAVGVSGRQVCNLQGSARGPRQRQEIVGGADQVPSARTLANPLTRNCPNPMACLIWPNTGSTNCLGSRYELRQPPHFSRSRMRPGRARPSPTRETFRLPWKCLTRSDEGAQGQALPRQTIRPPIWNMDAYLGVAGQKKRTHRWVLFQLIVKT